MEHQFEAYLSASVDFHMKIDKDKFSLKNRINIKILLNSKKKTQRETPNDYIFIIFLMKKTVLNAHEIP